MIDIQLLIIITISKNIDTYDLYIIAYISQHINETSPIILIKFSLSVKNDKITISDAIKGKTEYIF